MKLTQWITSFAALGLVGVALAGDQAKTKIVVVSDDGSGAPIDVKLDSDDLGFDLFDMQEGENQSIVDSEGRSILITRKADGFTFDVDGKSVDVPLVHDDHARHIVIHGEHDTVHVDHDQIVNVEVVRESDSDGDKVKVVRKVVEVRNDDI